MFVCVCVCVCLCVCVVCVCCVCVCVSHIYPVYGTGPLVCGRGGGVCFTYVPYMVQVPLKRLGQGEEVWQGVKFVIECDYFTGTA